MLRSLFLLFIIFRKDTVGNTTYEMTTNWTTTQETLIELHLVAKPPYPVPEGQTVHLHCDVFPKQQSIHWSHHFRNKTLEEFEGETDLILSKPEESGDYCCRVHPRSDCQAVFIISMHLSVGEKLGIAAFVFALLVLIIILAALTWMGWRKHADTSTISNTAAKGSPGAQTSSKGVLQQTNQAGDVYINYTSDNKAYSDLDLATMNDSNVYASL